MEQIKSFKEALKDDDFQREARQFGKERMLPWNDTCRRRYHRFAVELALDRGETVPQAALSDYSDLLSRARAFGQLAKAEERLGPAAKLETLAKSMCSPSFLTSAREWGKLQGLPYGIGAERAYHRTLVRKALERGEAVPAAVLVDHQDLREALRKAVAESHREGEALAKSRGEIQLALEDLQEQGRLPAGVLAKFGTYGVGALTDDIKREIGL